jgi:hypothetical protein
MFDHAQIESSLKQLKARSIVIVYQILCHSLLRRAWQGADSHRVVAANDALQLLLSRLRWGLELCS